MARDLRVSPSRLRGRGRKLTWLYNDATPPQVVGLTESPEWTTSDRQLMLGLRAYEATLCSGCGEPKNAAWHSHSMDEWNKVEFVCHACTARQGTEVAYTVVTGLHPDAVVRQPSWPAFVLGKTTTEPQVKPDST